MTPCTAVAGQDLFSPDRSLTGAVMLDDIDLNRGGTKSMRAHVTSGDSPPLLMSPWTRPVAWTAGRGVISPCIWLHAAEVNSSAERIKRQPPEGLRPRIFGVGRPYSKSSGWE
jgi:hypothetical protein